MIEEHFGDGFGLRLRHRVPARVADRRLGTAGSLRLIPASGWVPTHPLLVMNGDLVTEVSVDSLLRAHSDSEAIATMAVRNYSYTVPFRVAEIGHGG